MKLWYLSRLAEKNKMLQFDKDVTENQHTVKVQAQKGICGDSINCAISAECRTHTTNYDHVLTSNSTKYTKHISGG